MLETTVTALLPIVVTLLIGFLAGWERDFSKDQASVLNKMVMRYALPLLLFSGILSTPLDDIVNHVNVFTWLAIGMVGGFSFVFLVARYAFRSSSELAALRALVIAGPAVPFVGVPVLGVLFPNDADLAIAAGSLLMNLFQVPLAMVFLTASREAADTTGPHRSAVAIAVSSVVNACKQPVVWAPIGAFILLLVGVRMPKYLEGSFNLLGQATGGVALFAVGIILCSQKVSISTPVVVNVIAKNILLPGIVLLAMFASGLPATDLGLVAITLAIPSASIAVIFAVEYKTAEQEMASTLFWSTILSVATMGFFIWLTGG